jgi:SAM-dependent methyltransferase
MRTEELLAKMKADWDARARENPEYYIVDYRENWTEEDFIQSGEQSVAELILNDMINICQGEDPKRMRVLEIGCGAGRITRALSKVFGEVHAVDVSSEMVALAKRTVAASPNAFIHQNNGRDLDVLPVSDFDFAFSMCVFHHIPSKEVIESYIRQVGERLKPGKLFKFEVQGFLGMVSPEGDTWLGSPLSEEEMRGIAERTGFEMRYHVGGGEERFWLWFFKKG